MRMQAGRVRRALEHFYLTEGRHDMIVISLPKRTYQPEFRVNGHAERGPSRKMGMNFSGQGH